MKKKFYKFIKKTRTHNDTGKNRHDLRHSPVNYPQMIHNLCVWKHAQDTMTKFQLCTQKIYILWPVVGVHDKPVQTTLPCHPFCQIEPFYQIFSMLFSKLHFRNKNKPSIKVFNNILILATDQQSNFNQFHLSFNFTWLIGRFYAREAESDQLSLLVENHEISLHEHFNIACGSLVQVFLSQF